MTFTATSYTQQQGRNPPYSVMNPSGRNHFSEDAQERQQNYKTLLCLSMKTLWLLTSSCYSCVLSASQYKNGRWRPSLTTQGNVTKYFAHSWVKVSLYMCIHTSSQRIISILLGIIEAQPMLSPCVILPLGFGFNPKLILQSQTIYVSSIPSPVLSVEKQVQVENWQSEADRKFTNCKM